MDIKYNKQKLSEILKDVYELLKTPISIFDKEFVFITSYPLEGYLTDYCKIIREDKGRANKCRESDEKSCAKCKESNKTYSYVCHAKVNETITPIRFENDIIGYIMFGEYRLTGDSIDVKAYANKNAIDGEKLQKAYDELTLLTQSQIDATCNVLGSCILQFWLSEAISLKETGIAEKVKKFIDENLCESLTVAEICSNFFISRQRLNSVFYERFKISVKQYVLKRKIDKAKKLLAQTTYSVTEIAEYLGFLDYNNFIQRFKSIVGITPLKYRKQNS
ncbi:MAG: PocR ligand-binding domain-containing protein [Clostridia bacterium]|nr:PocR ligand-binding domain-containing protein [Clostridia bacterium]